MNSKFSAKVGSDRVVSELEDRDDKGREQALYLIGIFLFSSFRHVPFPFGFLFAHPNL